NDAGAKIPGANPLLFALGLKLKDESRAFFDTLHRSLKLPEEGDLRLDDQARAAVVKAAVPLSRTLEALETSARDDSAHHAFELVAERFGLEGRSFEKLRVDSPFQYEKQAALYLPNLPPPSHQDFPEQAEAELLRLISLTQGRAFLLFTSLAKMDSFHQRLHSELSQRWQVLKQGERPRQALLDAFVAKPSVLFASQSFWEGVDVVGEALSLVVVERLPAAKRCLDFEAVEQWWKG